ncbi:sulfotransferase family protein [Pseudomaricurvus sp.]|uniref:sulfotransferase family protein n=1 Tax=Pseudomaricurvus sp. TaxID=2004510 RepID=UPI003F6AC890
MLNAADIASEAEQKVGISDPESFVLKNLERLVDAINHESFMSKEGMANTRRALLNDMVNRLEGLKWFQKHPEIANEAIEKPVFLMGLPRSGTTYFQYLFDCDQRFRLIRTWEAMTPSPPPAADPASAEERRITWAERRRQMYPTVEGFEALHLHDEDGSEECHPFMEQSFGAAGLNNLYRVPSYFDYLLDEADLEASYRVHKRQLQLLQWRTPSKPWALKYPNHLLAVPEITSVYPDARFVMTHRDPVQTLASICKLSYKLRSARTDKPVDKKEVGRYMTHFVQRHINRIMDGVHGPHADRIIHVDYYRLVEDPVKQMLEVHEKLGIESPDEVCQAVAQWRDANPKNARGVNAYSFEEYGLDDSRLEQQFSNYMEYFSIPREQVGLASAGEG